MDEGQFSSLHRLAEQYFPGGLSTEFLPRLSTVGGKLYGGEDLPTDCFAEQKWVTEAPRKLSAVVRLYRAPLCER